MIRTKISELVEGDDVEAWLLSEVPGWNVGWSEDHEWYGISPTHFLDGILVRADEPKMLVERIRTLERMVAICAGRQGRVPVEFPIAGIDEKDAIAEPIEIVGVPEEARPVSNRDVTIDPFGIGGPSVMTTGVHKIAKASGYTGSSCETCGSMKMLRAGKCETCAECGTSSGCS